MSSSGFLLSCEPQNKYKARPKGRQILGLSWSSEKVTKHDDDGDTNGS